jgi:prepilin-type N-terminal cleavage/methylation domain-containing protein
MKYLHNHHTDGFTFLEVIIAVFVFSVIVAGVAAFSAYYLNNSAFSFEETQSIGLAQTGITQMIRDIREARTGEDGSWPIMEANDNEFIFFSDVTGDGLADRVRYFLNGTTLQKGVIQPTAVPVTYPTNTEKIYTIASYVNASSSAIFKYYNGNWPSDTINNPLAPASRISDTRYVTVDIKIDIQPNFSAQPFELTGGVGIRSMKDNL